MLFSAVLPGDDAMSGPATLACFKAYDIRGRIPTELNRELVAAIARAYAAWLAPKSVAVGYDIRLSSPEFAAAVCAGLTDAGVNVVDIGLCGTEEVYFATFHLKLDGGVMVTASHNPADYNGLKLVREAGKPISEDTGLLDMPEVRPGSPGTVALRTLGNALFDVNAKPNPKRRGESVYGRVPNDGKSFGWDVRSELNGRSMTIVRGNGKWPDLDRKLNAQRLKAKPDQRGQGGLWGRSRNQIAMDPFC
jgi:hypothetical protein